MEIYLLRGGIFVFVLFEFAFGVFHGHGGDTFFGGVGMRGVIMEGPGHIFERGN